MTVRVLATVLTATACTAVPPPPPESGSEGPGRPLAYPSRDAESLLGRPVRRTQQGSWSIADARNPGCEVRVRHVAATFRARSVARSQELTGVGAQFATVLALEARHGREVVAEYAVENSMVLEGEFRGDCGEWVVGRVFVGTGRRSMTRSSSASGRAGLPGAYGIGASRAEQRSHLDQLEWREQQAYAFEPVHLSAASELQLALRVPATITEGALVTVEVETNRPAWVVVYFLDAEQKGGVLWPSPATPEPRVSEGRLTLPTPEDSRRGFVLQASLEKPGIEARETLVAYALERREDFDRVRPEPGRVVEDGAEFAASVSERLAGVPLSVWARAVESYLITPRGKPDP